MYCVEAIFKIFHMGFVFGKNTYLKNGFNVIDLFAICVSIYKFFYKDSSLGTLK